jgi:hypothetical protein
MKFPLFLKGNRFVPCLCDFLSLIKPQFLFGLYAYYVYQKK